MDPNAAYAEIQSAQSAFAAAVHAGDTDAAIEAGVALTDAFTALDMWLHDKGFLPDAWRTPLVPEHGENMEVDELLWTVFVTALEGGIGYWAASSNYHIWLGKHYEAKDTAGFYSDIVDSDGQEAFEPTRIDRSTIAKGFERLAAGPAKYLSEETRQRLLAGFNAVLHGADFDFDADDADWIVQLGVHGEIVFG